MIRPNPPVVCPFDAKFEAPKRPLARRSPKRCEPFGLALDKRYAFRMGCAAGYCTSVEDAALLRPEHEYGRVVTIEIDQGPPIDWSLERIKGGLPLPSGPAVVLMESRDDADGFNHFDRRPRCTGVIALREIFAR